MDRENCDYIKLGFRNTQNLRFWKNDYEAFLSKRVLAVLDFESLTTGMRPARP
jgi:hypothetical protein